MEIIELKPPSPLTRRRNLEPFDFQITGIWPLPQPARRKWPLLNQVLTRRQSRRDFQVPITVQQLGDLLWHSARTRQKGRTKFGTLWASKPTPSGGGCHPIKILVLCGPVLKSKLLIYDSENHALGVRDFHSENVLRKCLKEIDNCVEHKQGTVILFVADLAISAARYRNPESLAWRDSGALLATLGLVAEGMQLEMCGLGINEISALRHFLKFPPTVIGVGGAVISGKCRIRLLGK